MRLGRCAMRFTATIGTCLFVHGLSAPAQGQDNRADCVAAAEQAQQLRSDHKLQRARQQLLICAQAACPDVLQTDCAQWLSEVETAMPSIVIKAHDPSGHDIVAVTVLLDGGQLADHLEGLALPIDPGIHRFRFESNGMVAVEEQVVVGEGEKQRALAVQFKPLEPKAPNPKPDSLTPVGPHETSTSRVIPYALGGVGLVALGSFAYFGIKGRIESDDLAAGCGATKSCSEAQVDPLKRHLLVADISLGVSLVALGVATWMFLSRTPSSPKQTATVQVGAGPRCGTVQLRWGF
jgi:hypothetical protein